MAYKRIESIREAVLYKPASLNRQTLEASPHIVRGRLALPRTVHYGRSEIRKRYPYVRDR
jgi:hypothetical protein